LPQKQARALEPVRPVKPKRQKVEFLLPEPVVREIKTRAARRQISGTAPLLEVLRDAGYLVTEADFIDLRKLPWRAGYPELRRSGGPKIRSSGVPKFRSSGLTGGLRPLSLCDQGGTALLQNSRDLHSGCRLRRRKGRAAT